MFGDLNDCYGKALQQEIAESNRLEQELIEAGNRYAERIEEERMNNEEWCKKNCSYYPDCSGGGVCNTVLSFLKEHEWHMLTEDNDGIIHGLPGDNGQYLLTDGNDIWIDDYIDGVDDGVWLDSGRDIREIKAWMYMPDLPILD